VNRNGRRGPRSCRTIAFGVVLRNVLESRVDSWQYMMVLGACLAVTLPLEAVLGARVYRRPAVLALALAPVIAIFAGWDLAASALGHWDFNARFILGWRFGGLPLEEWLFFVVVPVCAILTYEAVGRRPVEGDG
jgi:lycopene cyclase domain-containing protein